MVKFHEFLCCTYPVLFVMPILSRARTRARAMLSHRAESDLFRARETECARPQLAHVCRIPKSNLEKFEFLLGQTRIMICLSSSCTFCVCVHGILPSHSRVYPSTGSCNSGYFGAACASQCPGGAQVRVSSNESITAPKTANIFIVTQSHRKPHQISGRVFDVFFYT